MKLKEKTVSKCPKCNKIYFDNDTLGIKHKMCIICEVPTEIVTCYSRLRIERFAVICTLALILTISLFYVAPKSAPALKTQQPAMMFIMSFFIMSGFLMYIYHAVNEYISKKELSIFKEVFFHSNKPTEEELAFSWRKYFMEAVSFVGIFIIFVFLGAGIMLVGKLLN